MTLHATPRVPLDDSYVALVGKAVYVFAYYEWTIIHIIECLMNGFVNQYSRGKPLTSGNVKDKFTSAMAKLPASFEKVPVADLKRICDEFDNLIVKRNALIHAHPATDSDGAQILVYQTNITKPLPDTRWPRTEVESTIAAFDVAACQAGLILHRLR